MQVGGERKVIVPPNMGYGSKKSGPIPPNSTLIFGTYYVQWLHAVSDVSHL